MMRATIAEARAFDSWQDDQTALERAIGPLGDDAARLAPLLRWDDADDPPRTAVEIVEGLERTWRVIAGRLMTGSPTDAVPEAGGCDRA